MTSTVSLTIEYPPGSGSYETVTTSAYTNITGGYRIYFAGNLYLDVPSGMDIRVDGTDQEFAEVEDSLGDYALVYQTGVTYTFTPFNSYAAPVPLPINQTRKLLITNVEIRTDTRQSLVPSVGTPITQVTNDECLYVLFSEPGAGTKYVIQVASS